MIIKAKQGIGRLIRSSLDSGIISILDSRSAKKYKNDLEKCVYGSKITLNINDLEKFVEEKN